ncbi:MAG: hypothetical protein V7707_17170 [Motiliproteus sp.]
MKTPYSHIDVINSIIMCFSEDDPYLNFLSMDEIEEFRESIIIGSAINVKQKTFREAEEAYNAVGSLDSPQALKFFAKISHPVMTVMFLLFIVFVITGS